MDKLGDMELFQRVIKNGGLAAAGREVGLSPARVTARMNGLEQRYGVRLLNRTTRSVTLTEEGRTFYAACERVIYEVERAEANLVTGQEAVTGPLRVTATIDLGQQQIAPLLTEFAARYQGITPYVHLTDSVVNLIEEGFDLAIRYGPLSDSSLVARRLANSRRVICAAPSYIKKHGAPQSPEELKHHNCLAMVRASQPITTWTLITANGPLSVSIKPTRSANDGALVRKWAVEGAGLAYKSYCDIVDDLHDGRLVTLLDDSHTQTGNKDTITDANLYVVYPSREYLPSRTQEFVKTLMKYFENFGDSQILADTGT